MKLMKTGLSPWHSALLVSQVLLAMTWGDDITGHVTEFTLRNGLQVIVYADSSAPVVTAAVAYRVGSVDEPIGLTGISHMLEHMSFKRTDIYRPGQFFRIVDSAGGQNNGFTASYYTTYYETFSKDRWELGLRLEAARMNRCVFADSEFASEHQVVLEERRLHDNFPLAALSESFEATAFHVHPLRNPGIGWPADVARLTVDDVRDWYQRHYNPANAILVVAGDVKPSEVRPRGEHYFGRIKGMPVNRRDYYDVEPPQLGERRVTVHRRVSMPTLMIGYHGPGTRDSLRFAGDIAGMIIGHGRNSRLYKILVTDSGLATHVSAYFGYEKDPELFRITVTPKAESLIPRIERIVDQEILRFQTEPATERELQAAKNSALANFVFSRDDIGTMGIILSIYQITQGTWRAFASDQERISQVTADQVQAFAQRYLEPRNKTVGLLLPERREEQ
ncbi:MAG: pitrilysin family protein [candidate division WOR-3 bacterium]